MDSKAIEARREYYRQYYVANPEKKREQNRRYWEKRAAKKPPRRRRRKMIQQNERLTYNVSEAAAAFGVSRPKMYELLRSGAIPSFQIGTRRLISRAGLTEWVERQAGGAA